MAIRQNLDLPPNLDTASFLGEMNRHIHLFEEAFHLRISVNGPVLTMVGEQEDVEQACDTLIKVANENGGEDNITGVLVRCVEA